VTADGVEFVVTSDPENPGAQIAAAPRDLPDE